MIKTTFKDSIETSVPKGSAVNDKNSPSSSESPLKTMFNDAIETKVPNTRTGGALPEVLIDGGIASPATGLGNLPEPGKKFTIG